MAKLEYDLSFVKEIVETVISELDRQGRLRDRSVVDYNEVSKILYALYDGKIQDMETLDRLAAALNEIKDDRYYNIIAWFFRDRETIEKIAEVLEVEPSTVSRNKKRLCLKIAEFFR